MNLFIGSKTNVNVNGNPVQLAMQSGLPWKGDATLTVDPAKKKAFAVHLRIPGWLNRPVPGDLYRYADGRELKPAIEVNGKAVAYTVKDGYAVVDRTWKKGDAISIRFPMEVRQVVSRPEVKQNRGRVALQYGPLVYCVEGKDNDDNAWSIVMPERANYETSFQPGLLGGVNTISFEANVAQLSPDGKSVNTLTKKVTAIPYFSWNNRGASTMQVWLPTTIKTLTIN